MGEGWTGEGVEGGGWAGSFLLVKLVLWCPSSVVKSQPNDPASLVNPFLLKLARVGSGPAAEACLIQRN